MRTELRERRPIVRHACRLRWRPSWWVAGALVALGIAGAIGVWSAGVPTPWRTPLALLAGGWGIHRALRELARPHRVFEVHPDGTTTLDAMPIVRSTVHWRGPLAFVRARDSGGRVHRLGCWPDVLDAAGRRALRLALDGEPVRG